MCRADAAPLAPLRGGSRLDQSPAASGVMPMEQGELEAVAPKRRALFRALTDSSGHMSMHVGNEENAVVSARGTVYYDE